MKHLWLVFAICIIFAYGLFNTGRVLRHDIATSEADTGRVNLLCSYFYEYWQPREVLSWWVKEGNKPLMLDVVDKAAVQVYGRYYGLTTGIAGKETLFVLTAYPARLRELKAKRLSPGIGFWGIYEVSR